MDDKVMKSGIQTFLAEAGEVACYALSIIKLAERITGKYLPVVETLIDCINRKYIYYNWNNANDNDNFFVSAPDKMLTYLSGVAWTLSKEDAAYKPRMGEWIVQRWERVKAGAVTGHFRLPDWDSLVDSQTVKYGSTASVRVFRKA
jgi:hypothetical protein